LCSTYTCPAGYKQKTDASTTYCGKSMCADGDQFTCCMLDDTKCGGMISGSCDTDKFWDSAKAAVTAGTTAADQKTKCCTAKAMCSTITCPAGYKQKSDASTTYCSKSVCANADSATCCERDDTKCGGVATPIQMDRCDTDQFWDSAKTDVAFGSTAADQKTKCCTAKALCSTYNCAAGYKHKTDASTTTCMAGTCTTLEASTCCEADTTKCGGIPVPVTGSSYACDTGKYWDAVSSAQGLDAKADVTFGTTDADKKANCCTAKATCATYDESLVASRASKSETMVKLFLCMFAIAAVNN
jgi:hypothetical protein